MAEQEWRAQVLEAEQAVRLLAKSLAGADTSRREFETLVSVLTSAAKGVSDANQALAHMRELISNEHQQANSALKDTATETRTALEAATERLSNMGKQAVTVAAEQASSAARRMRELEENVDRATAQITNRLEKVSQIVTGLHIVVADEFSKATSSIQANVSASTNRLLESVRWAEESTVKSTTSAVFASTQKMTNRVDEIDKSLRQHTTLELRANDNELRKFLDVSVDTLTRKLNEVHGQLTIEGEKRFSRTRIFLLTLCFAEAAVVLGLALMLWRHW